MAHRHMNVEIGNEGVQFPEKEYINGIFLGLVGNFAMESDSDLLLNRAGVYRKEGTTVPVSK
jgi:hypothetical protein